MFSRAFSAFATAVTLLSFGSLCTAQLNPGPRTIQSQSVNQSYVQSNGSPNPLTIIDVSSPATVWYVSNPSDFPSFATLRSASGGYAYANESSQIVIEDPTERTEWNITYSSDNLFTISLGPNLFWTARHDSDLVYLEPWSGGADQEWEFTEQ